MKSPDLSPCVAPVAPRVLSPITGEPLPLVEEVKDLLWKHSGAPIRIVGGPGAGKTTALLHLEAMLGPLSITVLDEPSTEDLELTRMLAKMRGLTVIYSARRGNSLSENHFELKLAPWGVDDAIEYLRVVHPAQCPGVVSRLLKAADADFAQGNPELWRTALDTLAASNEAGGVRAALRYELGGLLLDDGAWKRACELCLVETLLENHHPRQPTVPGQKWLDDARMRAGEFREAARAREEKSVVRLLRHRAVRSLLAVEFVRTSLAEDDDQPYLTLPLPAALIDAIGATVAADETCLDRLHDWLYRDEIEAHATAASLLFAANRDWRPPRARPRFLGGRFPAAKWRGANLAEADLSQAHLAGADLSNAKLDRAKLRNCDLRRALLRDASLAEADAMDANLQNADLWFVHANKARFIRGNLRGVRGEGAAFDQADLAHADLRDGNFRSATFVNAFCELAQFDGANFENADFSGARLGGLDFAVVSSLEGAIFNGANLRRANLERLNLANAKFRGANLHEALLTGTRMFRGDFRKADLRGAKLAEIHWDEANLCHADLRGVSFHMGSSRSGLVGSPIACEGSRTGFYTDDYHDMSYKRIEEIRKANLRGADLRGANLDDVDFYLVDLRDALFDTCYENHLRRGGAILEDRE